MKNSIYLIIIVLLIVSLDAYAQQNVSGRIADAKTKENLPFASVQLINISTDSIFGGPSALDGSFTFKKIPIGKYKLQASVVGYELKTIDNVEVRDKPVKLGVITLTPSSIKLDEVQVVAEKSYIETKAGKRVINVGSDIINAGGSAVEILSMAPSVEVGIGGQVSIRGESDVFVLINGRETALSFLEPSQALKQIPVSSIEKIEVITNGGAEFGPDGTGGMINIILKQQKEDGIKATVGGNLLASPISSAANASLEYQKDKLGLSVSYGFEKDQDETASSNTRTYKTVIDQKTKMIDQTTSNETDAFHFLTGGTSYQINDSIELSLELFYETGKANSSSIQSFTTERTSLPPINSTIHGHSSENESFGGLDLGYDQILKGDRDLTLFANMYFGKTSSTTNNRITQDGAPSIRTADNKNNFANNSLGIDYNFPLTDFLSINSGLRLDRLKFEVDQTINNSGNPLSNRYSYSQNRNALFAISNWELGPLELAIGARMELFNSDGQQVGGKNFDQQYFNVFPNIQLSSFFGSEKAPHSLMFSYSKRINRPEYEELNPTVDYSDPLNIVVGNPKLKPEFAHVIELTHEWSSDKFDLITTVFNRITTNVIQSKRELLPNDVVLTTFINESNRVNTGIEVYLKYDLTSWWDFSNDFTIFNKSFNNLTSEVGFESRVNWYNKITSNFKPGGGIKMQIQMRYFGKQNGLYNTTDPYYTINAGVSKEVFKGKGNFNLSIRDLFDSLIYTSTNVQEDFVINSSSKYATRRINIGLNLNF